MIIAVCSRLHANCILGKPNEMACAGERKYVSTFVRVTGRVVSKSGQWHGKSKRSRNFCRRFHSRTMHRWCHVTVCAFMPYLLFSHGTM